VSIADNGSGSPQTVALSGTETAPVVSLSSASLTFASTLVGTTTTQAITLKNTGKGALSLSGTGLGISITGANASSYSQTNTCGTSVTASASCAITVIFKPVASGTLKATVSIADNGSGSPQTVALSGTGTAPVVSLSSASLTFASTPVGTTTTQAITLKNTGNGALSLSGTGLGISISGANASSYSQTNTCGTSVAASASCAITVTFKPAASGTLNATVSIADYGSGSPQTVALSGTAAGAATSPSEGAGNVYYVDNTIPDIHVASATPDCTTYNPTTMLCGGGSAIAYATIADVNAKKPKAGDSYLFRRGGIWREQLTDPPNGIGGYSGSAEEPIIFGSYGDSASPLPIISGANLFTDWTPEQVWAGNVAATVYYAPYSTIPGTGNDYSCEPYADAPTQVFENGSRLTENTSSYDSLAVGQWYLDTANSRIWARLTGDDNPSGHTIEASQRDFAIAIYAGSYITIMNLQTEDTNDYGISVGNWTPGVYPAVNNVISGVVSQNNFYDGIAFWFSANDTIISSTAAHNGRDGISFFATPDMLVEGNTTHDNDQIYVYGSSSLSAATVAGIKGSDPSPNVIVQDNLSYSNGIVGTSMKADGINFDTTGDGDVIRYNNIYSNTGNGIVLDANSGQSIYGNVVYGNADSGITAFADAQPAMADMQIYHNTIYGNHNGGITLHGPYPPLAGGCMNNAVINNIVVSSINSQNLAAYYGCENSGADGSGNVYTFNNFGSASSKFIVWGRNPTSGYVYESTYNAWEAAAGNCGGTGCSHSVESDPLFTSVSTSNFTLSRYSPAIGAGLNLGQTYEEDLNPASTWPSDVLLNTQSNTGGGWDIGAYIH
jgi:hypothetical protein